MSKTANGELFGVHTTIGARGFYKGRIQGYEVPEVLNFLVDALFQVL